MTPPFRRPARLVGVIAAITGLALGGLWWQRGPIASRLITRELAQRGVPARYILRDIGLGGAELTALAVGPADRPDLVARRVRVDYDWSTSGPVIRRLRLDGARLHGRIDEGGLHLGVLDRLRGAAKGPTGLPEIEVHLVDTRLTLDTLAGRIGLAATGSGLLRDGFRGLVAARVPAARHAGCATGPAGGEFQVSTDRGAIRVAGPVRAHALSCAGIEAADARSVLDVRIAPTLDALDGTVSLAVTGLRQDGNHAAAFGYDGSITAQLAKSELVLDGRVTANDAGVSPALRHRVANAGNGLDAVPVGPLARKAATAAARALGAMEIGATLIARLTPDAGQATLTNVAIRSTGGARLRVADAAPLTLDWPAGRWSLNGPVLMAGGGLPSLTATVAKRLDGDDWSIRIDADPYAAADARASAGPLLVSGGNGGFALSGTLSLDGPAAGGRMTGLVLPVDLVRGVDGVLRLSPERRCLTLDFGRFTIAGASLGPARLPLCATGDSLLSISAAGGLDGGAQLSDLALAGSLDGTPLHIGARRLRLNVSGSTDAMRAGLLMTAPMVRLGSGSGATAARADRLTLDLAGTVTGRFDGLAGRIANVPLLVDEASGSLAFAAGELVARGDARVRDAAPAPRFTTAYAEQVILRLAGTHLSGTAMLAHGRGQVSLGQLRLAHDFSRTQGGADLIVPALDFGTMLQPDDLTPLTRGVIANVAGTIHGQGHIRWDGQGVTSDGDFTADSLSLAAAFGPVSGLKGSIHFSDLLGLKTPPGQMVTLAEVNPGVAVQDGTIRYQLLDGLRVAIEGGRWPFAGGELVLEPTILDFGQPSDRHLTFQVSGLDAARFVQQLQFENLAATGTFDGVLPMVFNEAGGRIEQGRLTARPGGGTLAYVGKLSEENIGFAGKLAFDALKSMRYQALAISLDGALDGEIVSRVDFSGVNQAPVDIAGTKLLPGMTGLPFRFNITVRAPFRGLLNTARSFSDVSATVRSAVPADLQPVPSAPVIQPVDSGNAP